MLHVDLREWADLLLIAPLGANTLAKLANGLCDDLLSCTARAWDLDKPVVVAPAMNTAMWSHPMTAHHLAALRGVYDAAVVAPVSKAWPAAMLGLARSRTSTTSPRRRARRWGYRTSFFADW